MSKDKSLKEYKGKRIAMAIPGAPGISRVYIWNEGKKRYLSPQRGKSYCARRYGSVDNKKKREFEHFFTLEDARLWQISQPLTRPQTTVESASHFGMKSPKFSEVVERWQNEGWLHFAENTKIQYRKCLPFYEALAEVEIEKISARMLDELIAIWRKPKEAYRSTRESFTKEYDTLKYILNWYLENYDDAKPTSPFKARHRQQITLKAPRQRNLIMLDDDWELFRATIKKEGDTIHAGAVTQKEQIMRASETYAMKYQYLNPIARTYTITEHVIWPRVGGSLPHLAPGTKSIRNGKPYTINLFKHVVDLLMSLERHPHSDLIFHDDGSLLTYRQIQYRYDKAFKAAGLPFSSTHILRHCGSTSFYNATGDLLALQQMGTWSNNKMPQHYAKVLSSSAKKAIALIEAKREKEEK
ncbi:hypothetical protein Bb109J_c2496 [Bdellovibrio bacteriovorus]|uniref:tyrosine-type recombinase/integrase n=1 Tax=Bdellovibrio bacteriovorus TaxID=959 RepID=UPI00045BFCF0|nr:tyrosine-type recombinase/integrase [Bdellovibrio bacteriovorus]AHZ85184.1 hypothetical protein EP01_09575 [Bdellovibrio bacteriovorus]BEV69076.1 hypothetical protein Bb109J_c2496 [Bdellovibrio bacteriovorus]